MVGKGSYGLVYVETPLSLYIALACINKHLQAHGTDEFKFLVNNSDRLIADLADRLLKDYQVELCTSLNLYKIFDLIRWSYRNNPEVIVIPDIGFRNKLLITFLKCKRVYIIDDGLASIARSRSIYNLMSFFSDLSTLFIKEKEISYYSLFKAAFTEQPGEFDCSIKSLFEGRQNVFENKLFYICSYPTIDGMSLEDERRLIDKLIHYSKSINKNLIILPHRRDKRKFNSTYIYKEYILNTNMAFEEFYYTNNFSGCNFITLYSGAILVVSKKDNPGYLVNYFKPRIKQSFFDKMFLRQRIDNEAINEIFDSEGVVRVSLG